MGSFDILIEYDRLVPPTSIIAPVMIQPYPIESDYQKGLQTRYFSKRNNDNTNTTIIEIDQKQYNSFGNKGGIDSSLYSKLTLDWKITGPRYDVYNNDMIVVYGVENTNYRTLILKEKEMKGIYSYLGRDLIQYARISPPQVKR